MKFSKSVANALNACFMMITAALLALVAANVITGKAGLITAAICKAAMQGVQWFMVAEGFDRLPNGEHLPPDAKTLPPGIQLQEPVQKKVEQVQTNV